MYKNQIYIAKYKIKEWILSSTYKIIMRVTMPINYSEGFIVNLEIVQEKY